MPLLRYLLVGVANTVTGLSIVYGAMYFLHLDIVPANVIGYTVGIIQSFALNKTWTFGSQDHLLSSFLRFIVVLAIAYATNLVTVLVAHGYFGVNPYVAQAIGIMPYTATGFLGSRYFAFQTQRGRDVARKS
jgi:putative flippase GtrA